MSQTNTMSQLPFDTMGLFTFLRTYARRHDEKDVRSTVESWEETLNRVIQACRTQLNVGFTSEEEKELFELFYNLKCSVAGRFLWQLGTGTVERLGLPSLQNCFRRDTLFWTDKGIRSFADFKHGEQVVIRGRSGPLKATVKNFGTQRLYKLSVATKAKKDVIYTTANHRWLVNSEDGNETVILTKDLKPFVHSLVTIVGMDWVVSNVEETDLIEDVWCVSEPTEECFTLANGILTKNCSFVVVDEPVKPFVWTMNFLMLGCGVGYRLLPEDVDKLPVVKSATITRNDTKDADYIVPDSREGWVKLLGKTLKAHFYSGKGFSYSCTLLRSKGAPIKGFGGTASGPDVLCHGLEKISAVLNNRTGQKIRPVDALDIMNIIGSIVVAGNVRRSAQIAIGSVHDEEFLKAKRWDLGNIPNWRAFSNNSIVCNDINEILDNKDFWLGYEGTGEPYGMINLDLARSCGRLGEKQYSDPELGGFNPCAEQGLSNYETCCLAELYLPNIKTKEELFKCATYLYRICKHSLSLPCKDSVETEDIVHKNMRMGIGVSGYLQSTDDQRSWLKECYEHLRQFDVEYSRDHAFPTSIKLTTVKPSGCSRKDMLISTSKGLLRLDEIGDIEGKDWQELEDIIVQTDSNQTEKAVKFYVNGNVETRRILTKDGVELESSLEHRYRVLRQGEYVWKKVQDLKVGDNLCYRLGGQPNGRPVELKHIPGLKMKQPSELSEKVAVFLALVHHLGYIEDGKLFFVDCLHILGDICNLIESLFNIQPYANFNLIEVDNKDLITWFNTHQLYNRSNLPSLLRTSPQTVTKTFVQAFCQIDEPIFSRSPSLLREIVALARNSGLSIAMSQKEANIYTMEMSNPERWNDFCLDKIEAIESSFCETYDIEVENVHHYRLSGFISHNTLSILANCTPGIHPGFAPYYKRRVRIASDSPLISLARRHGYPIEYVENFDGSLDHTTQIVTFPMSLPEHTIFAENCSAVKQLEWVKKAQTEWSDNSVSVTVYYRKEELPEIKEWLKHNYNNSLKTVSFLLHSEHGFRQAPMEQITKEEYDQLVAQCKPITDLSGVCYSSADNEVLSDDKDCPGGFCPRK